MHSIDGLQVGTSLQEQFKAEGADVVAIAKAAGFTITTEDLNSHRQNLSADELEAASGGLFFTTAGVCPFGNRGFIQ